MCGLLCTCDSSYMVLLLVYKLAVESVAGIADH
jgi:hypothetical protein